MSVFEYLVDAKVLKIIRLFIQNKEQEYHLHKISTDANVPVATVFRIVQKLVKLKLVEPITIGKMKIYRLANNSKIKELQKVFKYD